jgi:hypothetical protein
MPPDAAPLGDEKDDGADYQWKDQKPKDDQSGLIDRDT